MNEWGVPDWRDATAYVGESDWHLARWKWEFLRRRSDLREEFDNKKKEQYERSIALWELDNSVSPSGVSSPESHGFTVGTFLIDPSFPAPTRLPNPRIGDQPANCLPRINDETLTQVAERRLPFESGYYRVDFDLTRPIEPQLKAAKGALKEFQKEYTGKVVGKRRHPEKWPTYLRVLDARDSGASWSEIADGIYGPPSPKIEDFRVENARTAHKAALALCTNF